jgi:hypothetical protein
MANHYPKYLYRGTTDNYIGPQGLINTLYNPSNSEIYFFDNPENAVLYAYLHKQGGDQDTIFSMLKGGAPVIVVVRIDDWIKKRLEAGWEYNNEWLVKGGFIPSKNIVQVFKLPANYSWAQAYKMLDSGRLKLSGLIR